MTVLGLAAALDLIGSISGVLGSKALVPSTVEVVMTFWRPKVPEPIGIGSMVPLFNGSMGPRFTGSLVFFVPWSPGSPLLWFTGYIAPWATDSMASWFPGHFVSCFTTSPAPWPPWLSFSIQIIYKFFAKDSLA